jgi:hypothetical protein
LLKGDHRLFSTVVLELHQGTHHQAVNDDGCPFLLLFGQAKSKYNKQGYSASAAIDAFSNKTTSLLFTLLHSE